MGQVLGPLESRRPAELTLYRFRHVIIPDLLPDDFDKLKWNILHHGILTSVDILSDGRVVDGRHRLAIAHTLGLEQVPVRILTFPTPFAIEWYAAERALTRRHLSAEQKHAIATSILPMWRDQARRQRLANLKQFRNHPDKVQLDPDVKGHVRERLVATFLMPVREARKMLTRRPPAPAPEPTLTTNRTPTRRPTPPPTRPRLPASTRLAIGEVDAQVLRFIDTSRQWPEDTQTLFWDAVQSLTHTVDELLYCLPQYLKGDPLKQEADG